MFSKLCYFFLHQHSRAVYASHVAVGQLCVGRVQYRHRYIRNQRLSRQAVRKETQLQLGLKPGKDVLISLSIVALFFTTSIIFNINTLLILTVTNFTCAILHRDLVSIFYMCMYFII